jgi:hypothetical protein
MNLIPLRVHRLVWWLVSPACLANLFDHALNLNGVSTNSLTFLSGFTAR